VEYTSCAKVTIVHVADLTRNVPPAKNRTAFEHPQTVTLEAEVEICDFMWGVDTDYFGQRS